MKIKSIPSPCFVQWTVKEKEYDSFKEIDINADDYKGTSISLPYPVLVVKKSEQLQTSCFQIEVRNYIGSCKKSIRGKRMSSIFNNTYKSFEKRISRRLHVVPCTCIHIQLPSSINVQDCISSIEISFFFYFGINSVNM